MEPLVYIMAVLGCADDGSACRQQRVEPVVYRSAVQCQMAMEDVMRRNTDLDFPVVSAACQQRGERLARAEIASRRG